MSNNHSFHIVDYSPWPLFNSLNLMNLIFNALMIIKMKHNFVFILVIYFLFLMLSMILWWRDILRESAFQGHHTFKVYKSMKISMILFISSEIMFFFSFFWAFFHYSLSPEIEISNNWPPTNIKPINPYNIPMLNTCILLYSGVTVTLTHFFIINNKYFSSFFMLSVTIFLGLIFSIIQIMEYNWTEFSINDNVYGSIFFMSTGFHGFHVMIGTIFLFLNLIRLFKSQFNNIHHFSFEAAAWYWHFVDVVWIYLFIFIYWWFYFLINMY